MTTKAQILIIEGNPARVSERMIQLGQRPYAESYAALAESLNPNVQSHQARPSEDGGACLPAGMTRADFDGAIWTGSAMSVYEDRPEIANQLAFARSLFETGLPVFGSCWGIQIAAEALGGKVRANPNGREIGAARDITPNDAGRTHPLFEGKRDPFDAIAVHLDEVEALPDGAEVLASNGMSAVQAMAIETGGIDFWGVQYHPEFDLEVMSAIYRRLTQLLIREGLFETPEQVETVADHYARNDAEALGLTEAIIDPALRRKEISNWLTAKVVR